MDINEKARQWAEDNPDKSLADAFIAGMVELGKFTQETLVKKEVVIKKKQKEFYNTLIPFVATFDKTLLREFYDFWCEPNRSMTKLRFELEKTWNTELRLKRWQANQANFKPISKREPENNGSSKKYKEI